MRSKQVIKEINNKKPEIGFDCPKKSAVFFPCRTSPNWSLSLPAAPYRSRARCAAHRVFNSQTYVIKSMHFATTLNWSLLVRDKLVFLILIFHIYIYIKARTWQSCRDKQVAFVPTSTAAYSNSFPCTTSWVSHSKLLQSIYKYKYKCICIFIYIYCRAAPNKDIKLHNTTMRHADITFQLLQQITANFSEERKLGQGTFGTVYKVRLSA